MSAYGCKQPWTQLILFCDNVTPHNLSLKCLFLQTPFLSLAGNTEINSVIYQWSSVTSQFILHQSIPTQGVQSVRVFVTTPEDITHLAFANADGPSYVYTWNTFNSRFDLLVTSDPAFDLVPLEIEGSTKPLLAAANYGDGVSDEMSAILQLTSVTEDSDYVPW